MSTPSYRKAVTVPASPPTSTTPFPGEGTILGSFSQNRNQAPPTNGDIIDFSLEYNIPLGPTDPEQVIAHPLPAKLEITYRVEE